MEINGYNVHRLFLAAVITAIKFNEDDFYSNSFYSKIGGVSINELNNLEDEFLRLINFNLWVEEDLYRKYKLSLTTYEKRQ